MTNQKNSNLRLELPVNGVKPSQMPMSSNGPPISTFGNLISPRTRLSNYWPEGTSPVFHPLKLAPFPLPAAPARKNILGNASKLCVTRPTSGCTSWTSTPASSSYAPQETQKSLSKPVSNQTTRNEPIKPQTNITPPDSRPESQKASPSGNDASEGGKQPRKRLPPPASPPTSPPPSPPPSPPASPPPSPPPSPPYDPPERPPQPWDGTYMMDEPTRFLILKKLPTHRHGGAIRGIWLRIMRGLMPDSCNHVLSKPREEAKGNPNKGRDLEGFIPKSDIQMHYMDPSPLPRGGIPQQRTWLTMIIRGEDDIRDGRNLVRLCDKLHDEIARLVDWPEPRDLYTPAQLSADCGRRGPGRYYGVVAVGRRVWFYRWDSERKGLVGNNMLYLDAQCKDVSDILLGIYPGMEPRDPWVRLPKIETRGITERDEPIFMSHP